MKKWRVNSCMKTDLNLKHYQRAVSLMTSLACSIRIWSTLVLLNLCYNNNYNGRMVINKIIFLLLYTKWCFNEAVWNTKDNHFSKKNENGNKNYPRAVYVLTKNKMPPPICLVFSYLQYTELEIILFSFHCLSNRKHFLCVKTRRVGRILDSYANPWLPLGFA